MNDARRIQETEPTNRRGIDGRAARSLVANYILELSGRRGGKRRQAGPDRRETIEAA
jgi:hypothetical protein